MKTFICDLSLTSPAILKHLLCFQTFFHLFFSAYFLFFLFMHLVDATSMSSQHLQLFNFCLRASPTVQNTLYNREWEQKKELRQPLYTSSFFLLMNSSSSSLMSYCSFFKSFFSIIIIGCWIKKYWKMCSC